MTDEMTEPIVSEFHRRFFEGAKTVSLEIEMLEDTYAEVVETIERNRWEPKEGVLTLLLLGLGYAQGRRLLEADDAERRDLADRLTNMESMYAVMKYRAYSYMKDNQTLDIKLSAYEAERTALNNLVKRLRAENEALKSEIDRLRRQPPASAAPKAVTIESEPARRRGLWERLRDRWKGSQ